MFAMAVTKKSAVHLMGLRTYRGLYPCLHGWQGHTSNQRT
jgi:hypothetical protein